jgi:hypothetical protein
MDATHRLAAILDTPREERVLKDEVFEMLRIGGATAPSGCAPHAMTAKPLGGNEAGNRFTACASSLLL